MLESQCQSYVDRSVEGIVGSVVLRVCNLDLVEAEEIYATQIELRLVDEVSMCEDTLGEDVIDLDVTQLEEVAVGEPDGVPVVVVLVVL